MTTIFYHLYGELGDTFFLNHLYRTLGDACSQKIQEVFQIQELEGGGGHHGHRHLKIIDYQPGS